MTSSLLIGKSAHKSDRARESKSGQMAPCTKVGGKTAKLTARADLFTLTAMSTMVCGLTIRPTGMECTATWTVQNMKEAGKRTSSMVRELKLGLMVPNTTEITFMARSTDRVVLLGLTVAHTSVSLKRITFRDKAPITGQTEECL